MANPKSDKQLSRDRDRILGVWVARLTSLVDRVEGWAREADWSTRRIDKRMDDSQLGAYQAPGLLLQNEFTRVMLEPIGRGATGDGGVVDLYLMPGYDDIASLIFYDDRWHVHYPFNPPTGPGALSVRDAPARPLTKKTLLSVLDELMQNAAKA